jgi:inositol phosphorylceramide mannosyltransferase catalytic subunit
MSSRFIRLAGIAFLLSCLFLYSQLPTGFTASKHGPAKQISAQELMARPLSRDLRAVPRLIHQSWADEYLPTKFQRWSETCRIQNKGWEYVLWTDDDNMALVELHFPWFLETYKNLPGVINQADVVRNMYMYIYGGVYADLDTECLRNMDGLFAEYEVPARSHMASTFAVPRTQIGNEALPIKANRTAFLGRMGLDEGFKHSLPNAWSASTPGHPFWLLVIEAVAEADRARNGSFAWPEDLTGPTRLYDLVNKYTQTTEYEGDNLDASLKDNPTLLRTYHIQRGLPHQLRILPGYQVYPFSWGGDGDLVREFCEVNKKNFNPRRCKEILGTEHWPSYTITYWSHSWDVSGHNRHNVELLDEREAVGK